MMDESRKGKTIKSAYDSSTFDENVSIHVDRKVGSATISPSGRDVALASYALLTIPKHIANIYLVPTVSILLTSILPGTPLDISDMGFHGLLQTSNGLHLHSETTG
jgi:hypothetical protein